MTIERQRQYIFNSFLMSDQLYASGVQNKRYYYYFFSGKRNNLQLVYNDQIFIYTIDSMQKSTMSKVVKNDQISVITFLYTNISTCLCMYIIYN